MLQAAGIPVGLRGTEKSQRFACALRPEAAADVRTPEELLRALHSRGVKTAIVSTKRGDTIQYIMERCKLMDQLEFVIGSEDVHAPKPDPQGLNMALERMGLSPKELLFCGDTVLDAGAAKNAGCPFCAVLNGTTPAEDFADFRPVHIAPDLFELRQWLEG